MPNSKMKRELEESGDSQTEIEKSHIEMVEMYNNTCKELYHIQKKFSSAQRLLGDYKKRVHELTTEVGVLKSQNANLKHDLTAYRIATRNWK